MPEPSLVLTPPEIITPSVFEDLLCGHYFRTSYPTSNFLTVRILGTLSSGYPDTKYQVSNNDNNTHVNTTTTTTTTAASSTESVGPCSCHDPLQARLEQERVAALVAERRQREAALVGKFDSDEIYNLEDENDLAMRQAQRESRCRVRALCEGRKLADTTGLITDDLIRELQTFLTRCVWAPNIYSTVLLAGLCCMCIVPQHGCVRCVFCILCFDRQ